MLLFEQQKMSPIRTSQEDSSSPMQPISTASLPGKVNGVASGGDYVRHDLLAGVKKTGASFEDSMIAQLQDQLNIMVEERDELNEFTRELQWTVMALKE